MDVSDLKTGFWLGIGLIAAAILWGIVAALFRRAERGARG